MNKLDNTIKWTATITTLVGAVLTALNYHPENIYAFNLGSILWLIWSIRGKEFSLIVVNAGLLLIYVLGLLKI